MTIRSLVGNVLAYVGTGLCILTVVIAMQRDASAAVCTGCVGCAWTGAVGPTGLLLCSGGCADPGFTSLCDNGCGCRPNPNNSGCNCAS